MRTHPARERQNGSRAGLPAKFTYQVFQDQVLVALLPHRYYKCGDSDFFDHSAHRMSNTIPVTTSHQRDLVPLKLSLFRLAYE